MIRTVLTYGTFDLFHVGHLNLLRRAKEMGDKLIVGVSTDEFNKLKGKETIISFQDRLEIVRSVRFVDEAFPEETWEQKETDIHTRNVHTLVMGNDWEGRFDSLEKHCEVVYLPRTDGISSTNLKLLINNLHINELKRALDIISDIVKHFE